MPLGAVGDVAARRGGEARRGHTARPVGAAQTIGSAPRRHRGRRGCGPDRLADRQTARTDPGYERPRATVACAPSWRTAWASPATAAPSVAQTAGRRRRRTWSPVLGWMPESACSSEDFPTLGGDRDDPRRSLALALALALERVAVHTRGRTRVRSGSPSSHSARRRRGPFRPPGSSPRSQRIVATRSDPPSRRGDALPPRKACEAVSTSRPPTLTRQQHVTPASVGRVLSTAPDAGSGTGGSAVLTENGRTPGVNAAHARRIPTAKPARVWMPAPHTL